MADNSSKDLKELKGFNHEITPQKDKIIIKSRKVSLWRVMLVTVLVMAIFLFAVQYVLNTLERSICESNFSSFKNSVILFEKMNNRYPDSFEELVEEIGLLGHINEQKYTWVPAVNGNSPHLRCDKFNLSTEDINRNADYE